MSAKNSLAAKAARREQKLVSKQVNNSINQKPFTMELTEEMKSQENQKVGVVIDLVKKSGKSVPVLFETDRNEFYEVMETLKSIENLESQKEAWFRTLVYALMEITQIGDEFFNAAVLSIASNDACIDWFNEYQNQPVGLGIMIHEGRYGYQVLQITYDVYLEILENYKSTQKLTQRSLN